MSNDLATKITRHLDGKEWARLKALVERLEPVEVSAIFPLLGKSQRALLFRSLPRTLAGDVFSFLDEQSQNTLLRELTDQETRVLLAELSPDDRTFLFEELPAPATQRLLNLLDPPDREEALRLLGYPEGSVGRLMSPDFATIRPEQTMSEALDAIRAQASESETLNMIYVVDERGRLIDDIRLRRLLVGDPSRRVSDLIGGGAISLNAFAPCETAIRIMKETGYFSLPVIDSNETLLGVVTVDDVLDLAVEDATEDFQKAGAIDPFGTTLLTTSFATLYSRRITWLVVLVFMNIMSGAGLSHFEELLRSSVAVVFFLPLLIASGGNAGAQTATLVIRSMALGEVAMRDYLKLFTKEIAVSLALGVTMAAAVAVVAYWRTGPQVAAAVSISMILIVFLGSLIGISLPFVLRRFGFDPAAASTPLVTSLADIVGVILYLGVASFLLGSNGSPALIQANG